MKDLKGQPTQGEVDHYRCDRGKERETGSESARARESCVREQMHRWMDREKEKGGEREGAQVMLSQVFFSFLFKRFPIIE